MYRICSSIHTKSIAIANSNQSPYGAVCGENESGLKLAIPTRHESDLQSRCSLGSSLQTSSSTLGASHRTNLLETLLLTDMDVNTNPLNLSCLDMLRNNHTHTPHISLTVISLREAHPLQFVPQFLFRLSLLLDFNELL